MSWTDERVEKLRKLWNEGLSAAQIAAELGGGLSRNAVIGKIHRLGIQGRAKVVQPKAAEPPKPAICVKPEMRPEIVRESATSSDGRSEGRALKGRSGQVCEDSQDTRPRGDLTERRGGSDNSGSNPIVRKVAVPSSHRPRTDRKAQTSAPRKGAGIKPGPSEAISGPPAIVKPIVPALEKIDEAVVLPVSEFVTIVDLTNGTCRWPIGTPGTEAFHFCGAPGANLEAGRPYCAHHAEAARSRIFTPKERGRFKAQAAVMRTAKKSVTR